MAIQIGKSTKGPQLSPVDIAKQAVGKFEEEYSNLITMKRSFEERYPEANRAFQDILHQEDFVRDAIKEAHQLVQVAKQTIGPFKCALKFSKAGYDEEKLSQLLAEYENGGEIIQDFLQHNIVKKITLTNKAVAYFAQNPELSDSFKDAWKDKTEMTPAVTDPKI